MKILYGVQGTGNGHITRARSMARAFAEAGVEVDWVFSGRPKHAYFDMQPFGDFRIFRGLTFETRRGRVLYPQTLAKCNLLQLYRDINSLNVEGYDWILSDFEPVSAWAGKRSGKMVIGISHQSAFAYDVPKHGSNPLVSCFMRNFAPCDLPVGLHWHHFNQPILPPLLEPSNFENTPEPGFYLVYLPFSDSSALIPILKSFKHCTFSVYQKVVEARIDGNVTVKPFSRQGFQRDLHRCEGVMCNAGFGLASEAIQLGRKLLVQPVKGQMEQQSNALALTQLGFGQVAEHWTERVVADWLATSRPQPLVYPDVARALVQWLQRGAVDLDGLCATLWQGLPLPVLEHTADEDDCALELSGGT